MAIQYTLAAPADAELLTQLRLEVLRTVNGLPEDHSFAPETVDAIRGYWRTGDHTTAIAWQGDTPVACATLCYIRLAPTYSHPTGLRAHLMNVYTRRSYRRQGIARKLLTMLLEDARRRGATEISLDATEDGRPLYAALGFAANAEGMILRL